MRGGDVRRGIVSVPARVAALAARVAALAVLVAACALLGGCARRAPSARGASAGPVVLVRTGLLSLAQLRVLPPSSVRRIVPRAPSWVAIELDPAHRGPVRLEHPEACPLVIDPSDARLADAPPPQLEPVLSTPTFAAPLGYDAPFTLSLAPRCGRRPRARWRVEPEQTPLQLSEDGLVLRAQTPSRPARAALASRGIEPVSYREQGRVRLWLSLSFDDRPTIEQRFERTASARASGAPSLSAGQFVTVLGPWAIEAQPAGVRATLEATAQVDRWRAALLDPGALTLRASDGQRLRLTANDHDRLPLDCGRSECHSAESRAWTRSPMQSAFARSVAAPDERARGCAIACHTVGEPGADDGGFEHRARALSIAAAPAAAATGALAPLLASAATVGCASCHGPAALPTPDWRWTLLRTAVCAQCHDAPPRYRHVEAWTATGMARFRPETKEPACARCHDTDAFLRTMSLRAASLAPPADAQMGLTCATCHAVHDERALPHSVRRAPVPATLAALSAARLDRSQPCVACHAPADPDALSAPTAAWFALAPGQPAALAPHASIEGGCVSCHRGEPTPSARGAGHSFAASLQRCEGCHSEARSPIAPERARSELARRTQSLTERFIAAGIGRPALAQQAHAARWTLGPTVTEAQRDGLRALLWVAEDRGAWAHNLPLARALLDRAERSLREPSAGAGASDGP